MAEKSRPYSVPRTLSELRKQEDDDEDFSVTLRSKGKKSKRINLVIKKNEGK